MKSLFLILLLSLLHKGVYSQHTKTEKIEALIEVMETEQRMNNMITKLVDETFKSADAVDSVFWNEYKARFQKGIADSVKPQIIDLYDRYFTEPEIDYMYEFYSSQMGQQTLAKYDRMLLELMQIGAEFGKTVALEATQIVEQREKEKTDYKINSDFTGCAHFRTGKFKYMLNDSVPIIYERDETTQTETYKQGRSLYSIEWLNECRYVLTLVETNSPYDQDLIGTSIQVNIFETTDTSYRYIYKFATSDETFEGEMIKVE